MSNGELATKGGTQPTGKGDLAQFEAPTENVDAFGALPAVPL